MPLNATQIADLNRASERVNAGGALPPSATNAGDVANLAYAAKQGYKYTPTVSAEKAPEQEPPIYPTATPATAAAANTPVATPTNTMSSDTATARKKADEEYLASIQAQDKIQADAAKSLLERSIAGVEKTYTQRQREAEESYAEQEATKGVEQFRLGTKGMTYGTSEIEKLSAKKQAYFDNLAAEKADKIAQLTDAYQQNDYARINSLRESIRKVQTEQSDFLQKERSNQISEYKTLTETNAAKVKTLAPALFSSLGDDPTENAKIIQDFAAQNGVDANLMMSAALTYQTDKQKEDLLNSKSMADILGNTQAGGTVNVPGVGDVKVVGLQDKAPSTITANNKVYNWQGGKWVDTGLAANSLTPEQVITALEKLGNTDILNNYLASQGVTVNSASTAGMRTDRHNNPTAMTTDVAKTAGLVEGVDYVKGDAFPDNPNLFTARLLGNPVDTTIKAIDKMGFTTQAGQNRWTYTDSIPGANNAEWSKLDKAGKENVIKQMYQHEGGSGSLFGEGASPEETAFLASKSATQKAAYDKLNPGDKSLVRQLISGDILLSDAAAGMGGAATRARLLSAAGVIDPNFSENTNKQRYAFKTAWNTPQGKSYGTRTAINTGLGHLAEFAEKAKALDNKKLVSYNKLTNYLKKETGKPEVNNFNTVVTALAGELASIYKNGTAPTDQETEEWRKTILSSLSSKQMSGVSATASDLISAKLASAAEEYKKVMGQYPDDPIINPEVMQSLKDAGVDVSKIEKTLTRQSNLMRVRDKKTGQTGTIPPGEFDANIYEKVS